MDHIITTVMVLYFSILGGKSVATQPSVILPDGTVVLGVMESFDSEMLDVSTDIEVYYGIPYAEAPVGSLRFKPPAPKKMQSPYSADEIGNACLQIPSFAESFAPKSGKQSEDCLFLDVFVPKDLIEEAPVLVMIHGGGFLYGAGQMISTEALALVAFGKIILVTINYRLGAMGFLDSGDGLIPGNLGLKDQQFALKWIKENVKAFRGDPSQVTVIGESAGSVSVGLHSLSPGSQGLFQNAIMQSGSPLDPWVKNFTKEYNRQVVETLAKLVGCSEGDILEDHKLLECLQRAPAEDINMKIHLVHQQLGKQPMLPVTPTVDGEFLPKDPLSLLQDEAINLNAKNFIVGSNADEGTFFMYLFFYQNPDPEPHFNSSLIDLGLNFIGIHPSLHGIVKSFYMSDPRYLENEEFYNSFRDFAQLLGDYYFMCSESKFSKIVSATANVYRYTMTYLPSNNILGVKWAGSSHADELQYVFGGPFQKRWFNKTTDEEKELSRNTMQYWINFMRSGDPNIPSDSESKILPEWSKFSKMDPIFKNLSPTMTENRYMRQRECHLIDNILPKLTDALDQLANLKNKHQSSMWSKKEQCESDKCASLPEKP